MSSATLDSPAVFQQKLAERGLQDLTDAFSDAGWNTLGNFAFAANFTPGAPGQDDSTFQTQILGRLLSDPKDSRESAIRRLHWEAHLMALSQMQKQVTKTDEDDAPKELPPLRRLTIGQKF